MFKRITTDVLLNKQDFKIDEIFFRTTLKGKILEKYELKKMKISQIKRRWFDGKIYELNELAPFKYLNGDKDAYVDYCNYHKEKFGQHVVLDCERFNELINKLDENGYDPKSVIICDYNNVVLDGQHRSCYILYKYGPDYEVNVLRLKFRPPYCVMIWNFIKRLFRFLSRP